MKIALAMICALLITSASQTAHAVHDLASRTDADLSGPQTPIRGEVPLELKPDQTGSVDVAGSHLLNVQVTRRDHDRLIPVKELSVQLDGDSTRSATTGEDGRARFVACSDPAALVQLRAVLKDDTLNITNGQQTYSIVGTIPCRGDVTLLFNSSSNGGQALGIWQIATQARAKLKASIGLDFWKAPLDFVWPAEGDYYQFGQVHITRGDYWDVVGHEMGHGIYDLGELGEFGGGQHKIDQCYSEEMALSEGWASFFSAWVSVDLSDADAKFEYMVPRRAPIRFENIPDDVCKGQTNEWRVTGFFWDMIDLHDDGEKLAVPFAQAWNALKGSRVSNASQARQRMEQAGFDSRELQLLWDLNFKI